MAATTRLLLPPASSFKQFGWILSGTPVKALRLEMETEEWRRENPYMQREEKRQ
jgi:hypothetical protein